MGRTQAVPKITFFGVFLVLGISTVNVQNLHKFKVLSVFPPVFFDTYFRNHSFTSLNLEISDVSM